MDKANYYLEEFDEWASLADSDPNAFEHMRKTLIESFINEAPVDRRTRLRCLQWRIDQERARAGSPLGACIRLSRMMWDRVFERGGLVENLEQLADSVRGGQMQMRPARILAFRERTD